MRTADQPHRGGHDPVKVPADFWDLPDVLDVLGRRDVGALFRLLREHCGVSQLRIAMTVGMTPARVGEITRGRHAVGALATFERLADGLVMPDHARIALGLAPSLPGTAAPRDETTSEPDQDVTPERIAHARKDLGRHLAAWRDAAGLTQVELAGRIFYARSTLAGAETGREHLTRTFWQRADRELNARGALLAAFEDMSALVHGRHHRVPLAQTRQRAAQASDGCGCAVVVGRWNSSDVRALREAMRLPVRAFAHRLGVHVGTVTAWESPRRSVPIALAAQETLDGALRLADPDVRTRFAQLRPGPEPRLDRNIDE